MKKLNLSLIILIILVAFCAKPLFAQAEKGIADLDRVKEHCDEIIRSFETDEISRGFITIRKILILPEDELSYIEKETLKHLNVIEGRFGKIISSVLVSEQMIEDLVFRRIYVLKYEYHGIRIIMDFYKGKENLWFMNKFKWDDQISLLLDK